MSRWLRRRADALGWLGALAAAILFPLVVHNAFYLSTAITALIFVNLAVAYDLVVGRIGALSFAQPVFLGFGAYAAGILAADFDAGLATQFALAVTGAAALALAIGIPSFRLSLHAFAIGTLAFAVIAQLIAQNWISLTGGPLCVTGIPMMALHLPGLAWTAQTLAQQYAVILAIAAGTVLLMHVLPRRRIGLAFTAVRDDPILAASQGLWPTRIRLIAFVLSAALAAVPGVFVAHFQSVVCPDTLGTPYTIALLIMVFIGGRASLRGVVLGAILFTFLPQFLRITNEARLAIYGVLLLLTVISFPDGIEHLLAAIGARLRRGAAAVPPVLPGAPPSLPSLSRTSGAIAGGTLEVRHLHKRFRGIVAVSELSFTIGAGELVGLIGPNGSGKTTTIDCLSGFQRPDAGAVLLDGRDVVGLPPHRLAKRGLVRSFQATRIFGTLTAEQNIAAAALGRSAAAAEWRGYLRSRASWPELGARIDELIEAMRLGAVRDRPAATLSYGQRKLVQLAAALVLHPRVLLLDEPAAGVNATLANMLRDWMRALADAGLSILLVEHNMELVTSICDRLVVLDHGVRIAEGAPAAVIASERVQEAYFGR